MNDKKKNTEPQEVKESSPGTMLRAAREAKGFSVEHIASQLRLRKEVIEDIEGDRHERLPAPIFVRGYIKSYAALVGIDASTVNASYQQYVDHTDQEISLDAGWATSQEKGNGLKRKKGIPFAIAGLLVTLAVIVWLSQSSDDDQSDAVSAIEQADSAQVEEEAPVLEPPVNEQLAQESTAHSETEAQVEIQQQPAAIPQVQQQEKADDKADNISTAAEVAEEVVEVAKVRIDRLEFVFSGDSWVDVSDSSGKRLIYRMVKSGDSRTVTGVPPFKITLGNAPQTVLLRNGTAVDLRTYTRGNVAKFSLGKINE